MKGSDESFLQTVAAAVRPLTVLKGCYIFRKGDEGEDMYFIRSGIVDIMGNNNFKIVSLKEGSYFGEIAIIEGISRTASAVAACDTELFYLKKDDFEKILDEATLSTVLANVAEMKAKEGFGKKTVPAPPLVLVNSEVTRSGTFSPRLSITGMPKNNAISRKTSIKQKSMNQPHSHTRSEIHKRGDAGGNLISTNILQKSDESGKVSITSSIHPERTFSRRASFLEQQPNSNKSNEDAPKSQNGSKSGSRRASYLQQSYSNKSNEDAPKSQNGSKPVSRRASFLQQPNSNKSNEDPKSQNGSKSVSRRASLLDETSNDTTKSQSHSKSASRRVSIKQQISDSDESVDSNREKIDDLITILSNSIQNGPKENKVELESTDSSSSSNQSSSSSELSLKVIESHVKVVKKSNWDDDDDESKPTRPVSSFRRKSITAADIEKAEKKEFKLQPIRRKSLYGGALKEIKEIRGASFDGNQSSESVENAKSKYAVPTIPDYYKVKNFQFPGKIEDSQAIQAESSTIPRNVLLGDIKPEALDVESDNDSIANEDNVDVPEIPKSINEILGIEDANDKRANDDLSSAMRRRGSISRKASRRGSILDVLFNSDNQNSNDPVVLQKQLKSLSIELEILDMNEIALLLQIEALDRD